MERTLRFEGEDYRTVPGMDKTQKLSDFVTTASLSQGLALQLQLLSAVPQCCPLLSLRQHFPIPQSLKQLLGTVFRDFAGLTGLASLLWDNSWRQNILRTLQSDSFPPFGSNWCYFSEKVVEMS